MALCCDHCKGLCCVFEVVGSNDRMEACGACGSCGTKLVASDFLQRLVESYYNCICSYYNVIKQQSPSQAACKSNRLKKNRKACEGVFFVLFLLAGIHLASLECNGC